MKRLSPALVVALASGAGAVAFAGTVTVEKATGPVVMTDQQMEQTVAGMPSRNFNTRLISPISNSDVGDVVSARPTSPRGQTGEGAYFA